MRLLCNENIPSAIVVVLRQEGHDVVAVKESMRGASDTDILARARTEDRVIVTQDKDFGELAFRVRLPAACGVMLFRLNGARPEDDFRHMLAAFRCGTDVTGKFAVICEGRMRIRAIST